MSTRNRRFWECVAPTMLSACLCWLTGCSQPGSSSDVADATTLIGTVAEPFSELAIERIIPVRVIMPLDTAGDPNTESIQNIQFAIKVANEIFRAAGVQFYVSRVDRLVMPVFSVLDARNVYQWSSVRDQLKLAFPNLSLTAWSDTNSRQEWTWLDRVGTVYGTSNEIAWWIHKNIIDGQGNGGANHGSPPDQGGRAQTYVAKGSLLNGFAHEGRACPRAGASV